MLKGRAIKGFYGLLHRSTPCNQAHSHASSPNDPTAAALQPNRAKVWWRVAQGLGAVTAATAAGAFYVNEGDPASIKAGLGSVPRAISTVAWYIRAAAAYRACKLQFPEQAGQDYQDALAGVHASLAPSLLRLCETSGGVYIKAAQLATTVSAVPQEYRKLLEKLQDDVTPCHPADLNTVFQQELQQPLEALFAEFEQKAHAAASLAQVHRAKLWTGETVAVKVQYPGLGAAVTADLTVLTGLARAAEWLFPDGFRFEWILAELRQNLRTELDFRVEAANSERLRSAIGSHTSITVPAVVPELSGVKILTMQWMEGCKVTDLEALRAAKLRPRDVGNVLLDAFARMQYVEGWVHGDAHSGNLLVRPAQHQRWWWRLLSGGWQWPEVVVLDHGLYVHLPDRLRLDWCRMWAAFVVNDMSTATQIAQRLVGEQGAELLPVLLKPGGLGSLSKEDRKRLRSQAGLETLGDVGKLLERLPRELTSVLRITAVVRTQAAALGASLSDRLRINAVHALRGMAITREGQPDSARPVYIGDLSSRATRLRIQAYIWAMRTGFWVCHAAVSAWEGFRAGLRWLNPFRRRLKAA
ncbi:hypothetical protein WJX74_006844 [Apatococcus lobatus]|uniref:ABC1 atypical kinase-like domain-containing protein n=1 Tax=Apatococcus lobatus TaxID=904363 RepID=A0AAW1SH05_9CHLO